MNASLPQETFAARVLGHLRRAPDRVFLRHVLADLRTEELTFRDFFTHAMVRSCLYDRYQVPVGGTVILVLSNPRDVFLAEAGALLTGRIPIVSAHPSAKLSLGDFGRTLLPLMENADPSLIVGDPEFCTYLSAAIGRRVASFDDIELPKVLPKVVNAENDTFFIQYSSGTTGTKKGVAISQAQLIWQVDAYAREIGLRADDHIVSWLPYYHDMGLITSLMMPLLTGVPITVMSPFDWVKNPLMLLKVIARDRGTLTWLPNFAYNFLAQAAKRAELKNLDLSALRGVVNCSEPVSPASHALFLDAFARHGLKETALAASYAMAETTFAITSGGFGRPLRKARVLRSGLVPGASVAHGDDEIVSSGHIVPGTELRIVGPDGNALGDNTVGEIAVRSPSLMSGYFKNPDSTAKAFAGGFFLTGDLGYTAGEDVFVTGRIKDLIITAGRNIYPQDIEAVVNDLPQVISGRCVAFGVADESRGTENVVIVAERRENVGDGRSVATAISQAVTARFDISLADVHVVAPGWLRKSTSGKIARGQNRERYVAERKAAASAHAVDPASPLTAPEDIVRKCVFDVTGVWIDDAGAPLVTSGLVDSLALTNLLLSLEEAFGKPVPAPDDVGYDAYDSIAAIVKVATNAHMPKDAEPMILVFDRQVKANLVLEGPRDFDSLILGSSRAFMVRAERAAKYGLKAFQATCAGVRMEELYCMAAFFCQTNRAPLKHVILGTDPIQFAPHLPIDVRLEKSPRVFGFLDAVDQKFAGDLTRDDIELDKRSKRFTQVMRVRYNAWDLDLAFNPKTGDLLKIFGKDVATMTALDYDLSKSASKWTQQFLTAKSLTHLHPRRLYYFEKMMDLLESAGCAVTIYINPLHPEMVAQLGERTPYMTTQQLLIDHIRTAGRKNVRLFPFAVPADFGGVDGDYFDGVHMGRVNGDRLLDALLKT